MGVKLFVGAKVRRRDWSVRRCVRRLGGVGLVYPWQDEDGSIYSESGRWGFRENHPYDIVAVLNPEDDPDRQVTANPGVVNNSIDRTAPPGIPDELREGWERSAYGFSLTNEEVRLLWSMVGFPLPAPRKRCDDCNCTGKDTATVRDCETCHGRGYLPV